MVQAFGHLSEQMLVHILLMNALAPLLAAAINGRCRYARNATRLLLPAAALQVAVLWAWHAPPALDAAMQSAPLHAGMQVSLLAVALWFWMAVFSEREARWRAILALLVTGKLFCLLGVLLVFAPRALYPGIPPAGVPASALADQQLAGLFMLVACPVTYVVAGVVVAARWLARIDGGAAISHASDAGRTA